MGEMADPYATLGIKRDASEAEVKKAYRKLAKELHPDRNKDNPKATERFSAATSAYDILTDKEKRARFDRGEIDGDGNVTSPFAAGFGGGGFNPRGQSGGFRSGGAGQQFEFGSDNANLGGIFEGLFGGGGLGGAASRRQPPARGPNIAYKLNVPFEDAAALNNQRITLGDGKTIDLKLPPGVETGTQMRLAGKGQIGPGGAGDAVITIEITPHSFFTRDGDNIRLDLPISLTEAVIGGPVKVPTVDGPVMLQVPKNATSGQILRLRGRGFHAKGGARGDQLLRLLIDLPAGDTLLKEFAENWEDRRELRKALNV